MKKLMTLVCLICMVLVFTPARSALAADTDSAAEPSNVTITVVMPDTEITEEPEPVPEPAVMPVYPVDVTEIREGGQWQIVKTYELSEGENPGDIPRESFERSGWTVTLTDILRKETANAETREHSETVTLSSDSKELEIILPLFSQTMEYTAEDGFTGVISLDAASIKVETAGTKTSSYTMSVTREYPRLSAADTSLVPKTVEDKGKTYTLAGVDWQAGNTVTVDYEAVPEYYTAVATYTATGSSTKVTGYTVTADYTGTLAKLSQGKTVYTAYFSGEEIRTPLEMTTPPSHDTPEPVTSPAPEPAPAPAETPAETAQTDGETGSIGEGALFAVIILAAAVLSGGTIYYIKKKGKGNA
jgi:hypothetical protein